MLCKICSKESQTPFCGSACKSKYYRTRYQSPVKLQPDATIDATDPLVAPQLHATPTPVAPEVATIYIGNRFSGYKTLMHPNTPHCSDCQFIPDGNFIPNWFKRHIERPKKGEEAPRSQQHALEMLRNLLNKTESESKLGLNL